MCACIPYLNPGIRGAEFFNKPHPLVNHLDNLMFLHEREGDVRPGMETHDLTEKETKKQAERMAGETLDITSFKIHSESNNCHVLVDIC